MDTLAFPGKTRLALTDGLDGISLDGQRLELPGAVYVRGVYSHPLAFGVDAREAMDEDWRTTLVAFREKTTLLRGLLGRWEALGVPLYNPESTRRAQPVRAAARQVRQGAEAGHGGTVALRGGFTRTRRRAPPRRQVPGE